MSTLIIVVVVVVVVVVLAGAVAVGAWTTLRRRRREHLQKRFGPEYERAAQQYGNRTDSILDAREKKVESYDVHPLSHEDRERFTADWTQIQAQFVDEPGQAVLAADRLIRDAMSSRGYPSSSFDDREEAASVQFPDIVENYRKARAILQQGADASTEDLREAMVLYRSLFEKVVEPGPAGSAG